MKFYNYCIALAALLMFTACSSIKTEPFFEDMNLGTGYPVANKLNITVQPEDRLIITVEAKTPELAIPFNTQRNLISVAENGSILGRDINKTGSSSAQVPGYLVDAKGEIDFPTFGKIYVEGRTLVDIKEELRKRIVEGGFIKDPLVTVSFANFKIIVLGETSNNVLSFQDENVTILDVLAKSGGLTDKSRLDWVTVIRNIGGKKQIFKLDIRSANIFQSPCYYLQQNDIVYVRPKYKKRDTEGNILYYLSLATSIPTSIVSLLILLKK